MKLYFAHQKACLLLCMHHGKERPIAVLKSNLKSVISPITVMFLHSNMLKRSKLSLQLSNLATQKRKKRKRHEQAVRMRADNLIVHTLSALNACLFNVYQLKKNVLLHGCIFKKMKLFLSLFFLNKLTLGVVFILTHPTIVY